MSKIESNQTIIFDLEERFSPFFSQMMGKECVLIGDVRRYSYEPKIKWHRFLCVENSFVISWLLYEEPLTSLQVASQQLDLLNRFDSLIAIIGGDAKLDLSDNDVDEIEEVLNFKLIEQQTKKQFGEVKIGYSKNLKINKVRSSFSIKDYLWSCLKIRVGIRFILDKQNYQQLGEQKEIFVDSCGVFELFNRIYCSELSVRIYSSENIYLEKVENKMEKKELMDSEDLVSLDLGCIDISLDDLLNLREGSQIDLERKFPLDILINVGGAPWATGQLSQEEEKLKVTVDQLLQV